MTQMPASDVHEQRPASLRDDMNHPKFRSDGWLVFNIDEHADAADRSGKLALQSKLKDSRMVVNCYEPGESDEMHCHPGSEHTYLVWKGTLHVTGVEAGEELTLGPGDFVQIKGGYYYQLHNPGTETAVYCQFGTVPARPPKQSMVFFSESRRGKQAAAAGGGAPSG